MRTPPTPPTEPEPAPRPQAFIVATAGHVDHGKSALVKALTGTDPDRLPEEKARGITIDLGFAHLELASPDSGVRFSCGIVDVPGHEDFVKNMVAGVGSIDVALLVVAADDGWMPQTEEHLQILTYLGVRHGVVALTKVDLAPDPARVAAAIGARLAGTPFAEAPVIPTSVITGQGLADLREALARELLRTPPPADVGKPRLAVDRAFVLPGIGTVVTGTLTGGCFARGDPVIVQPGSRPTRIRSCQSHGRDVDRVLPGTRTALNLPDLAPGETVPAGGIRRGDVVTWPGGVEATTTLDVTLERSSRTAEAPVAGARPLRSGTTVQLHLGSGHVPARLLLLRGNTVSAGETTLAQLRLEHPVFAFVGDRFVVRDAASQGTLAGGMILAIQARRPRTRDPVVVEALERCRATPQDPSPFLLARVRHAGIVRAAELLVGSRFSSREIVAGLGRLVAARDIVLAGPYAAEATAWQTTRSAFIDAIETHHRHHPELPGLPLAELRGRFERDPGWHVGFEALLAEVLAAGFVTQNASIRRLSHRPALAPALAPAGQALRATLARHPLDPPSRRDLAPDAPRQQALRFLIETGEVVEVAPDLVLTTEAWTSARARVVAFLRDHGRATASELRQCLGTNRRVLIPLLERLDREGVTRRLGDYRQLPG